MQATSKTHSPLALYHQLVAWADSHPILSQEREVSANDFLAQDCGGEARLRFLEWFLLERSSSRLGGVPVALWLTEIELDTPESQALLDNWLGVFRALGKEGDLSCWEDLWSRRTLFSQALGDQPEHRLAIGRWVQNQDGSYTPMPGVFLCDAPGLEDALTQDLGKSRAMNSVAQLSQLELEKMFFGYSADVPPSDPEKHLATVLGQGSDWTVNTALDCLRKEGEDALLDRLAFETGVDLQAFQKALSQVLQNEKSTSEPPPKKKKTKLETEKVKAALDRFSSCKNSGKGLAKAFAELEEDLGIVTETRLATDNELSFGPSQACGLQAWIEAYQWEVEATGKTVPQDELGFLEAFSNWMEQRGNQLIDASEIQVHHVLGYLFQRTKNEQAGFSEAFQAMENFLKWCLTEQNAPIESLVEESPRESQLRWEAMAGFNKSADGGTSSTSARLDGVLPAVVSTQDGDQSAPVLGLPNSLQKYFRVGDWVLGEWKNGQLHANRLLPKEATPETPQDT